MRSSTRRGVVFDAWFPGACPLTVAIAIEMPAMVTATPTT